MVIDAPNPDQMHFLLELTERCYGNLSTIYCSQYSVNKWYKTMISGTYAKSVMDRIVHSGIRIDMGD